MFEEKVTLITQSLYLQELMLADCPIKYFPSKQHIINRDTSPTTFIFNDMGKDTLLKYLDMVDKKLNYRKREFCENTDYTVTNTSETKIIRKRRNFETLDL